MLVDSGKPFVHIKGPTLVFLSFVSPEFIYQITTWFTGCWTTSCLMTRRSAPIPLLLHKTAPW